MVVREAQTSVDCDDCITAVVELMLIEVEQRLGRFECSLVVIGDTVPWLLPGKAVMQDVDIDGMAFRRYSGVSVGPLAACVRQPDLTALSADTRVNR